MKLKNLSFVVLSLISINTFAADCLQPHTEAIVLSGKSKAIAQTQARNTWDDWIWRGPIFQCPTNGTVNCMYQWSKAQTTGYSWQIGGSLNLSKIPVVGGALSIIGINGNYSQNKSLTTTFGWNATISAGYYAQPIQVVKRRWTQGTYKGAYVNTGLGCKLGIASTPTRSWYTWDANKISGLWQSNIETSTYATYYVHK